MTIPTIHPYDFDPTHGYSLAALEAMRPLEAPPLFDEFWRARYVKTLALDTVPKISLGNAEHPAWLVQDIVYRSTDDFEIGGWLLLPKTGKITRGLVIGHGYGGRTEPNFDVPVEGTALLFPCFRGLSRSRHPPISEDPAWHVLHDIDDKDRYILGGCVEDIWAAVSTVINLYPELDGKIGYSGTSFGGGIGAIATAFDPRIDRGHLVVPTFGNMPVWLALPCVGSGNAVQKYAQAHSQVVETLQYFDSATAASRIKIPMLTAVACFDPAVAPPCQFSVANAITNAITNATVNPLPISKHHEIVVLDAGHFDYDGMSEQAVLLAAKVRRFFKVE